AILAWLYEEKAALQTPRSVNYDDIAEAVGWVAEPITDEELRRDITYLREMGYVWGIEAFGGDVFNPVITSEGENFAAQGISVRPGPPQPATTSGVTHNYNITNNAPAQMAINSDGYSQTMTVEAQQDQITTISDLLDQFASEDNAPNA